MVENNITNIHFALGETQKKEICYGEDNGKPIISEHEYGHFLLEFYDFGIDSLNEYKSILKSFNEDGDRKKVKSLKTFLFPHLLADYRAVLEKVTVETVGTAMNITDKLIVNYQFLKKLLTLDLKDITDKNERYKLISGIMNDEEKSLYLNYIGKNLITINEKSPMMLYSVEADLTGLIAVYLLDIINRDVSIQICQNCGKPFFPMGKAIYCDRVNPDSFKTCKRIGAMKAYDINLKQNDEMREYRKAYKRNFARVRNGLMTKEEFEKWKIDAKP